MAWDAQTDDYLPVLVSSGMLAGSLLRKFMAKSFSTTEPFPKPCHILEKTWNFSASFCKGKHNHLTHV